LEEFGVTNADVLELAAGRAMRRNERAMLHGLSVQAWEYYEASRTLLPMIDADARGAMWVLVTIYSGLLRKIDEHEGDVFSQRVSVPTGSKVMTLLRGAAMSLGARRA
jgi:phytoene synthase